MASEPYRIEILPAATRQLARLPLRYRRRIARAIDSLSSEPRPQGCRKIRGGDNLYRIRSGEYRIVYQVEDRLLRILVIRVRHRREAYRRLK